MNNFDSPGSATRVLALLALATALAACNRGGEEQAAAPATPAADGAAAVDAAPVESPEDKRLANAVVTGKTTAPVDLKYDVLAKPDPGQPFEIELALLPRLAADRLDVEVTGIPGLTVISGGVTSFPAVVGGERHATKVLVQADAPGIYYVNVITRMVTQVQTEARTFSVPVVVGSPPSAQKAQPATDASGAAVQSLPAVESGGEPAPTK